MRRAAAPALASFFFTLLVQSESFALRVAPSLSAVDRIKTGLALPFQWQSALAAIAIGVLFALIARASIALAVAMFAIVHILLVFDQAAFRLFGDHIAIGQMDGGWRGLFTDGPMLALEAFRAGGVMLWLNLLILGALCIWLARATIVVHRSALLVYPAVTAIFAFAVDVHGLDVYPLAHVLSTRQVARPLSRGAIVPRAVLDSLRDSTWRDIDSLAARTASANIHAAYEKPNIILIVLESVGAEQILPGGALSASMTPNLAAHAANAVIFPTIYGMYPATTRAHVPIMTGGRTITWGAVDEELTHRLRVPTLVSALKGTGYRTGLFAAPDLRFGSLADFYRTMPWDTVMYYLDGKSPLTKRQEIHSWGVNEDAVRPFAAAWADSAHRTGPFFLEFHTIATHHPYGTWGNDRGPAKTDDDRDRYVNSIHYTDAVIGRLLADLEKTGAMKNTIVAITGDHGEAFAEYHANNTLHRNAIWEENIRNFLILLTPSATTGATIHRIGGHGDVMPTLLSLSGADPNVAEGQDLLAANYKPRVHYFYKDIAPQLTGLRDGRWKFLGHRDGSAPQLYDLSTDSTEQHNVASEHPDRVALYRELTTAWYVQANDEYTSQLVGWDSTGKRRTTRENLGKMTPPEMKIGHFEKSAGERFVATPVVGPNDPVYVYNRWGLLPGDVTVRIAIISPNHKVYGVESPISADWDTSWYHAPIDLAKEPGVWRVSLWQGARRLAQTTFRVAN